MDRFDMIDRLQELQDDHYATLDNYQQLCRQIVAASASGADTNSIRRNIVIDTETTGLDSTAEILQLSIVDADDGATLYNQYYRPLCTHRWPDAQRINYISPDDVADCPYLATELPKIQSILSNADHIIGYNLPFDINMLELYGLHFDDAVTYTDVMQQAAVYMGDYSNYHHDYRWHKLTVVAYALDYDWGDTEAHDSLADCHATLHCYRRLCSDDCQRIIAAHIAANGC